MTPFLDDDLKGDEGCRLKSYQDTKGIWTIGYGHAHVSPGLTWDQEQCDTVLADDIAIAVGDLDKHVPWWRIMNDPRQDVLANMCFNMGWPTLSEFHDMLTAASVADYETAADEMLDSHWAKQVGHRAVRLAQQMRTGVRA